MQAFPAVTEKPYPPSGQVLRTYHAGMTLRDYFAGQALIGWLSDSEVTVGDRDERDNIATSCYAIADAMLEARNK